MDDFWSTSSLVGKIGAGSYSKVYSVIDSLGQPIALKVQPNDLGDDLGVPPVGLIEINALKSLQLVPEIINLYDIYFHPKRFGLTFPIFSEDLHHFIRTQPLDIRIHRVFDLIRTLVRAEAELGRLGYQHFDIKPSNILVDDDRFVLTDLGLSVPILCYENNPRVVVQTTRYRAPEQLAERKRDEFPPELSEIWSIGLVAIEMLLGQSVFKEDQPGRVMALYPDFINNIHLYGIPCIKDRIQNIKWRTIINEGGISGQFDVDRVLNQLRSEDSDLLDQIDPRVITSCKWMLELDPWDRISPTRWLELFDTPLDPLRTQKFKRHIDVDELKSLVNLGIKCRGSMYVLILACDILSRYTVNNKITILEKMACLRISDHLIEYGYLSTRRLFYMCRVSLDKMHDFLSTERKIVKELSPLLTLETQSMMIKVKRENINLSNETEFMWLQKNS